MAGNAEFVILPFPDNPGALVRAHCRDRLAGQVASSEESSWSCILRLPEDWRDWSEISIRAALKAQTQRVYKSHREEWLAQGPDYPILVRAEFEVLPIGEGGHPGESVYDVPLIEERGREVMVRAMQAWNDPGFDAKLAAAEELKDRRQSLVLHGHHFRKNPERYRDSDESLCNSRELTAYLACARSKRDGEGVSFEIVVRGETMSVTADWDGEEGRVHFSLGGETRTAETDSDGRLPCSVLEELLRAFGEDGHGGEDSDGPADETGGGS
jgi:hypothetical protein